MRIHRLGFLATLVFSLSIGLGLGAVPGPPVPAVPMPVASPSPAGLLGTLTADVPAGPRFVLHGTLPLAPRPFDRRHCPLVLLAPDGTPLNTQWELVARLRDHMVVELSALVVNQWSGRQVFGVVEGTNSFGFGAFDADAVALVTGSNYVDLVIQHQVQGVQAVSLSGLGPPLEFHRLGPNRITMRRNFTTDFGGVQAWFTLEAGSRHVELVLNWHNGGLPARPDAYFKSAALVLPAGWTWTSMLPDPVMGAYYLVQPDDHILPQRMERSFRVVLHPVGETPNLTRAGWAVGDWSFGGYMPQSYPLPSLDHTTVDLSSERALEYALLASGSATIPGDPPVSPLWPARGVYYGGMTGGIDIEQCPGVPTAVTGQADGLLRLYVEQLRYASRQMGCIYEADGHPLELDDYLNPDGSTPWSIFNNVFQGGSSPPFDAPFYFSQTGPGVGSSNYNPLLFQPIDSQHLVRRTKANKALLWLDNDPLARLYVTMDAELERMSLYEGKNGDLNSGATAHLGTWWGRGEGWAGDVMATAFAVNDARWRVRNALWFWRFVDHLTRSQMPNGLFTARNDGKTAEDPPYGDGTTAFYWVGRSNEQSTLMLALRGIQETTGLDASAPIRECARGLWEFAWKVGTFGPLERYPAGPIGAARYTYRSEIPAGLTDTVTPDGYHTGGAIAAGLLEGQNVLPAVFAHTGTNDLAQAKAVMQSWGTDNIANRAVLLRILQYIVP